MDTRSLPPDFQILQSNDTFQYAPLPDPRTHIRLLRQTNQSLLLVQKKEVYTYYDFDVYLIDHFLNTRRFRTNGVLKVLHSPCIFEPS